VRSSPAIGSDGTVYVGSSDNKLYAIKTDSKGLAKSPWPMRGQNAQHTGRASATKTSSATPNNPEVTTAIEAAIRKAAGKPTGKLTTAELAKVTELAFRGDKLTDVTALEKLPQLTYLDLEGNRLTDVPNGLEKLKQLEKLKLDNNQLTDVKGLEKCAQLRQLWLNGNQLTDVKGLEKLSQLTFLHLEGNQLTDVKGLEKLDQLTFLYLLENPDLTKAQIDQLQKALPKCAISSNPTK
jgi:Leucine-rich repeat (LRR) protein